MNTDIIKYRIVNGLLPSVMRNMCNKCGKANLSRTGQRCTICGDGFIKPQKLNCRHYQEKGSIKCIHRCVLEDKNDN